MGFGQLSKKAILNFIIAFIIQIIFIIPNSKDNIIMALQYAIICASVPIFTDFILLVSQARF